MRNYTLIDMVRSMLSYFTLPISLWMEALKTIIHILNRIPSKSVSKMSYELWIVRNPLLDYLRVWVCPPKNKIFNPNASKFDYKIVSYHFIGSPEKSMGFHFYYPNRHTKLVETRHAIFLEDEIMRVSIVSQEISLEHKWVYVPTPMIYELIPLVPVREPIIPTFEVGSSLTAPNVHETHIIQETKVPNAIVDEE
jgi:hypothetical protein